MQALPASAAAVLGVIVASMPGRVSTEEKETRWDQYGMNEECSEAEGWRETIREVAKLD